MGMTLYGIATTPLAKQMRSDIPEALVPWYADDSSAVGKSADAARSLKYLQDHGPKSTAIILSQQSVYTFAKPRMKIALELISSALDSKLNTLEVNST